MESVEDKEWPNTVQALRLVFGGGSNGPESTPSNEVGATDASVLQCLSSCLRPFELVSSYMLHFNGLYGSELAISSKKETP